MTTSHRRKISLPLTIGMAVEAVMGISYFGIFVLQQYNSPVCYALRLLFMLLHAVLSVGAVTYALYCMRARHTRKAIAVLCAFLAAVTLKDFIGNFASWNLAGQYGVGDSLLLSLFDTLCNTVLLEGLLLGGAFWLSWLFFLYARRPSPPPERLLDLTCDVTRGSLLTASLCTLRLLGYFLYDAIVFCREAFWILSVEETLSIVLEFVWILICGVASFLLSCPLLRYLFSAQEPPAGSTEIPEEKNAALPKRQAAKKK